MTSTLRISLIGDHDAGVTAHRAIPLALRLAGQACGVDVEFEWIATDSIGSAARVASFDGLWCVPASPYRSTEGTPLAIGHRESNAFLSSAPAAASSTR